MLTIIKETKPGVHKGRNCKRVIAACECGGTTETYATKIKTGRTKSCGCLRIKKITKHGMHKTSTYKAWLRMKQRCSSTNKKTKKWYYDRGITVCESWEKFENFLNDMGNMPKDKTSLDRINNDLGYFKENCRWATSKEQGNNRRTNISITYNGKSKTLTQWARHLGINESTFYYRYKNKMPLDKMFSKESHNGNNQYSK